MFVTPSHPESIQGDPWPKNAVQIPGLVPVDLESDLSIVTMSPAPWSHPPPDGKLILEKGSGSKEGNEIASTLWYVHQSKRGSMLCFESMWTRNTVLWQAHAELFCPFRKLWLRFFSLWLKGLGLRCSGKIYFIFEFYNALLQLVTILFLLFYISNNHYGHFAPDWKRKQTFTAQRNFSFWKYFKSSRA